MMKKAFALSLVAIALSACQSGYNSASVPARSISAAGFKMKSSHYSDVAKIRAEANRLGTQVREGKLTKVQAAQHLNRFRLELVGHNNVDDSVYEVYLRSAVDNQRGSITAQQQRAYVENALKGWQQRWSSMHAKPNNPAFTNFLLEFMGMKPLQ